MMRRYGALPAISLLLLNSCRHSHGNAFRVLAGTPNYLLRSPDGRENPFPEILRRYNGFELGGNGMDLRPRMELRIENAYYRQGMPKRGLNGYLGTEIARYRVGVAGGLNLLSVRSMADRPLDQLPIQQLIPAAQQRYRFCRFYFEILFKKSSATRGSVLLGADSPDELSRVAALLISQPDIACESRSSHCTVFPEACSVSIEMEIVVNGESQSVLWGSTLESVVDHRRQISLRRLNAERWTPVQLDTRDPEALKLPLLPGDRVTAKEPE